MAVPFAMEIAPLGLRLNTGVAVGVAVGVEVAFVELNEVLLDGIVLAGGVGVGGADIGGVTGAAVGEADGYRSSVPVIMPTWGRGVRFFLILVPNICGGQSFQPSTGTPCWYLVSVMVSVG